MLGGCEGMPPRNFLKIDALRLNLRAFQSQNIIYCRVKITVKSRVISNYKHHYGTENMVLLLTFIMHSITVEDLKHLN